MKMIIKIIDRFIVISNRLHYKNYFKKNLKGFRIMLLKKNNQRLIGLLIAIILLLLLLCV